MNSSINYFKNLPQTVATALQEDIENGDLSAALIPAKHQASAHIICREKALICGRPWFDEVFNQVDKNIKINWLCNEGDVVSGNQTLCTLEGPSRSILTAERTALNFLQTLSATATITNRYLEKLYSTSTKLLDTRKTLPGLRLAQKYAVATGGGDNHRIGLFDAILLKENHLMAAGGIDRAVEAARALNNHHIIEVETENLTEVKQALAAGVDIIMLDNFSLDDLAQAVRLNQAAPKEKQAKLEVSGNVEIEQLATLAKTGVDYISSGAITKHIQAIDLSMRFKLNGH